MGVHRSIVATGRAIRNVGGLKRALVETVRGILVWGWGMRSQSFASSHHLIPRPSTPAIPNVLRGPSHRALTSKSMQSSVDVDGRADLVETWQRSNWGSTSRDQTASPHSHQNRTKQADHPSAKLGIEEAPHHDRLWQIDEAFTPPTSHYSSGVPWSKLYSSPRASLDLTSLLHVPRSVYSTNAHGYAPPRFSSIMCRQGKEST